MNITFNRVIAASTLGVFLAVSTPMPAQAGFIGSDAVIDATVSAQREANLAHVQATLNRADVKQQLEAMGVDASAAQARAAALSDSELAQLSRHIDQHPAGGILEILGLIFLVLIILDYVGVTKIFHHR